MLGGEKAGHGVGRSMGHLAELHLVTIKNIAACAYFYCATGLNDIKNLEKGTKTNVHQCWWINAGGHARRARAGGLFLRLTLRAHPAP